MRWDKEDIKNCTPESQAWFHEIIQYKLPWEDILLASPRMFMGMLNAGSTTPALLATGHRINPRAMDVIPLRSSDNSMTKYTGNTSQHSRSCVEYHRRNLEKMCINLSPDKTFSFKGNIRRVHFLVHNMALNPQPFDLKAIIPLMTSTLQPKEPRWLCQHYRLITLTPRLVSDWMSERYKIVKDRKGLLKARRCQTPCATTSRWPHVSLECC